MNTQRNSLSKGSSRLSRQRACIETSRLDLMIAASCSDVTTRVQQIRSGVHASDVLELAACMGVSKAWLTATLEISPAALRRKSQSDMMLSHGESERVLSLLALIGQVRAMVAPASETEGFDAARWLGCWLSNPLPALGGVAPSTYLDTSAGRIFVSQLLSMMQSGAYA